MFINYVLYFRGTSITCPMVLLHHYAKYGMNIQNTNIIQEVGCALSVIMTLARSGVT